jgi:preprotein translocase subunit SecD
LVVLVIVMAVIAAAGFAAWKKPAELGLDLQGGLEVVLKATPTDGKALTTEQLDQAVEVIR